MTLTTFSFRIIINREQTHLSLPLDLRQNRLDDLYTHQNIRGTSYSDGDRYIFPRQEHLTVNVDDCWPLILYACQLHLTPIWMEHWCQPHLTHIWMEHWVRFGVQVRVEAMEDRLPLKVPLVWTTALAALASQVRAYTILLLNVRNFDAVPPMIQWNGLSSLKTALGWVGNALKHHHVTTIT